MAKKEGVMSRSCSRRFLKSKTFLAVTLVCAVAVLYILGKHIRFIRTPCYTCPKIFTQERVMPNIFPDNASRLHVQILKRPFIIPNSELCSESQRINHVIMVHSSGQNFDRRQSYRQTWANPKVFDNLNARTVFILGKPSSEEIQEEILKESEKYGDIVQGDFREHYDNLTLKAVTGLRWITEHCSQSEAVIKVDDDVFMDIFRVVSDYIPETGIHPRKLICWAELRGTIIRQDDPEYYHKWLVPDELFPGLYRYPMPFCFGEAVFMSTDMARQLYLMSLSTPFYRMDDVYVYGILANMVPGVRWQNEEEWISKTSWFTSLVYRFYSMQNRYIVGTARNGEDMKKLWDMTQAHYGSVEH